MHLIKPLAKTWLALALCAAFLAPANAQSAFGDRWYLGGGLSALDLDVAQQPDYDTSHAAVHLVGGVPLNEYLDAEIRLGFGLGGDDFLLGDELLNFPELAEFAGLIDDISGRVDVGIDTLVAIGLRAGAPIGDAFRPYLALGFSSVKTDLGLSDVSIVVAGARRFASEDFSDSETETDIFYGIGASWRFGQGHELTAEFSNYLDKDGTEISGFSMRFTASL